MAMARTVLAAVMLHRTVPLASVVPEHTVAEPALNTIACPPTPLPTLFLRLAVTEPMVTLTSRLPDTLSTTGETVSVVAPLRMVIERVLVTTWPALSLSSTQTAAAPAALVAVMVMLYTPVWPLAAVPDNVAVPLWLSTNVTPTGSAPDFDNEGTGAPEVVKVTVAPGCPMT